jgi:sugar/nucleoside kinase (ribokinase family)
LKDGARGAVPSPRVEAVDTTGAGDAATAGVLHQLASTLRHGGRERPSAVGEWLRAEVLETALRYGCAAGAVACLTEGAIPSLPTAEAVEAMLSRSA